MGPIRKNTSRLKPPYHGSQGNTYGGAAHALPHVSLKRENPLPLRSSVAIARLKTVEYSQKLHAQSPSSRVRIKDAGGNTSHYPEALRMWSHPGLGETHAIYFRGLQESYPGLGTTLAFAVSNSFPSPCIAERKPSRGVDTEKTRDTRLICRTEGPLQRRNNVAQTSFAHCVAPSNV